MTATQEKNARNNARRKAHRDNEVPMTGKAKTERVALGLELLSMVAIRGVEYTQDEIAAWCGCTTAGIFMLEKRALKRLRENFRRMMQLNHAEIAHGKSQNFL